jgi:hypothetical protein
VDVFLQNCANAIWNLKGPNDLPFYVLVTSAKKFNHISKDANILHLKSSGSHRPSYFLTSTPSRHTSHPWLIYGKQLIFDMDKYDRPTTIDRFLTWIGLDI